MPARAASDNVGAMLAMLRRRDVKECLNPDCKTTFEGLEVANYCSDECRYAAAYVRRKERTAVKARKEAAKRRRRQRLVAKKAIAELRRKPRGK